MVQIEDQPLMCTFVNHLEDLQHYIRHPCFSLKIIHWIIMTSLLGGFCSEPLTHKPGFDIYQLHYYFQSPILGYSLYYLFNWTVILSQYLEFCTYSFGSNAQNNNTTIFLSCSTLSYPIYGIRDFDKTIKQKKKNNKKNNKKSDFNFSFVVVVNI